MFLISYVKVIRIKIITILFSLSFKIRCQNKLRIKKHNQRSANINKSNDKKKICRRKQVRSVATFCTSVKRDFDKSIETKSDNFYCLA